MNFRSFAVVVGAFAFVGLAACKSSDSGAGGGGQGGMGSGGETGEGGTGGTAPTCDPAKTCADAITTAGDAELLCAGASFDLYDALANCTCSGACATACGDTTCAGAAASADCQTCLQDTNAGCGTEFNACSNDI